MLVKPRHNSSATQLQRNGFLRCTGGLLRTALSPRFRYTRKRVFRSLQSTRHTPCIACSGKTSMHMSLLTKIRTNSQGRNGQSAAWTNGRPAPMVYSLLLLLGASFNAYAYAELAGRFSKLIEFVREAAYTCMWCAHSLHTGKGPYAVRPF